MDFKTPSKKGFTVYSKSGCKNCLLVKSLFKSKNFAFKEINCDEYIIENKQNFLLFLNNLAQQKVEFYPAIFYDNKFVGSYSETIEFINKLMESFFDDTFTF
jgi:glutaredoxin